MYLKMLKDIPEKRNNSLYLQDHIYDIPNEQAKSWLDAKDEDGNKIVELVNLELSEEIIITPMPYSEEAIEDV